MAEQYRGLEGVGRHPGIGFVDEGGVDALASDIQGDAVGQQVLAVDLADHAVALLHRRQQAGTAFVIRAVQALRGVGRGPERQPLPEIACLQAGMAADRQGFALRIVEPLPVQVIAAQLDVELRIAQGPLALRQDFLAFGQAAETFIQRHLALFLGIVEFHFGLGQRLLPHRLGIA
jgi:hypothetical protein